MKEFGYSTVAGLYQFFPKKSARVKCHKIYFTENL